MKKKNKQREPQKLKRRSILFIPGIRPDFFESIDRLKCDAIIFDLEDSVAVTHKKQARETIYNFLNNNDLKNKEVIVRVNNPSTDFYRDDIKLLFSVLPHTVMIPKVESRDEILQVNWDLSAIEQKQKVDNSTEIIPLIETAKGLSNRQEIVMACPRVTTISFGAEDLSADLRIERVPMRVNPMLTFVMIELILLARTANIYYIDSVFPWFRTKKELEDFEQECLYARHMGAIGKMLIHPNHIEICNNVFTPSQEEIKRAEDSLKTLDSVSKKGLGAAILDDRMIDAPQIKASYDLLERAKLLGAYPTKKKK